MSVLGGGRVGRNLGVIVGEMIEGLIEVSLWIYMELVAAMSLYVTCPFQLDSMGNCGEP